jgi:hypothetical protein
MLVGGTRKYDRASEPTGARRPHTHAPPRRTRRSARGSISNGEAQMNLIEDQG